HSTSHFSERRKVLEIFRLKFKPFGAAWVRISYSLRNGHVKNVKEQRGTPSSSSTKRIVRRNTLRNSYLLRRVGPTHIIRDARSKQHWTKLSTFLTSPIRKTRRSYKSLISSRIFSDVMPKLKKAIRLPNTPMNILKSKLGLICSPRVQLV